MALFLMLSPTTIVLKKTKRELSWQSDFIVFTWLVCTLGGLLFGYSIIRAYNHTRNSVVMMQNPLYILLCKLKLSFRKLKNLNK